LDGINAYKTFKLCVILSEVIRQDSSQVKFKQMLENLRVGKVSDDDIKALESRVLDKLLPTLTDEQTGAFLRAPVIFSDNASVRDYNT